MLYRLTIDNKPILIVATEGSKVVAYYLQLIIVRLGINGVICEVIEPRDYFYKANRNKFSNLIAISTSGNTNGIKEALNDFNEIKFLITQNNQESNYQVISWGNKRYEIERINDKIKELLIRSREKIDKISVNFKNISLIQIMSGYDTKTSNSILETNLVEIGLSTPVIHDKGSFCHRISNLLFQYPNSYIFMPSKKKNYMIY